MLLDLVGGGVSFGLVVVNGALGVVWVRRRIAEGAIKRAVTDGLKRNL